jgi:molybdopterin-guanine dinucleotide biosynthesis protein A
MGVDKALLEFGGVRLADRTAEILMSATEPTIEVGPGYSFLRSANDPSPGLGPLAALAHGVTALQAVGWVGPALVVATDLPLLSVGLLAWLAGYPSPRSIVPVDRLRPQPLCARYQAADLETAQSLVRRGERSMKELLAAIDPLFVGSDEWSGPAGHRLALADADSPADLKQFGWTPR